MQDLNDLTDEVKAQIKYSSIQSANILFFQMKTDGVVSTQNKWAMDNQIHSLELMISALNAGQHNFVNLNDFYTILYTTEWLCELLKNWTEEEVVLKL